MVRGFCDIDEMGEGYLMYKVSRDTTPEERNDYERVYEIAKRRVYNMTAVCKLAGVDGNHFRNWINGTCYLSHEKIQQILNTMEEM